MQADFNILSDAEAARHLARLRPMAKQRLADFIATVERIDGAAEIRDPETNRSHAAEAGARMAKGSQFNVTKGRALVRLDDGTDLWVAQGTSLELTTWAAAARAVRVIAGRMLALVAPDPSRPFRAVSPFAEVLVTGTAFEMSAAVDMLEVSVLHGSVEVINPRGRARLALGQTAQATRHEGPRVTRVTSDSQRWNWLRDISASSNNDKVTAAFRAATNTIQRQGAAPKEQKEMTSNKSPFMKIVMAAVVLALVAGGVYFANRTEAPAAAASATATEHEAEPMPEKKIAKMIGAGDKVIMEVDLNDPNGLQDALASLPPEDAAVLGKLFYMEGGEIRLRPKESLTEADKAAMKKFSPLKLEVSATSGDEHGDGDVPAALADNRELFQREAQTSLQALGDMLKNGADPATSKAQVEAALTDSYRKLLNDPAAKVEVGLDVDPTSGQQRASLKITKEK